MKLYLKVYDVYKEIGDFEKIEDIIDWLEDFYKVSFEETKKHKTSYQSTKYPALNKPYELEDWFKDLRVKIVE